MYCDVVTQWSSSLDINQLSDIPKWGETEVLNLMKLAMENDISYLEFVFFAQDKIALNGLDFPERYVSSICRCLDILEDIFSSHDNRVEAELNNAVLIAELFNRISRIVCNRAETPHY